MSEGTERLISLTLPWAVIVGDNHRLSPRKHGRGLFQTSKYRTAKAAAKLILQAQYQGHLLPGPVELHAKFHVPNNIRRDVTNLSKAICDCLTGTVIEDDCWQVLPKTTWEVVGIDRENPHVNLYIVEAA